MRRKVIYKRPEFFETELRFFRSMGSELSIEVIIVLMEHGKLTCGEIADYLKLDNEDKATRILRRLQRAQTVSSEWESPHTLRKIWFMNTKNKFVMHVSQYLYKEYGKPKEE